MATSLGNVVATVNGYDFDAEIRKSKSADFDPTYVNVDWSQSTAAVNTVNNTFFNTNIKGAGPQMLTGSFDHSLSALYSYVNNARNYTTSVVNDLGNTATLSTLSPDDEYFVYALVAGPDIPDPSVPGVGNAKNVYLFAYPVRAGDLSSYLDGTKTLPTPSLNSTDQYYFTLTQDDGEPVRLWDPSDVEKNYQFDESSLVAKSFNGIPGDNQTLLTDLQKKKGDPSYVMTATSYQYWTSSAPAPILPPAPYNESVAIPSPAPTGAKDAYDALLSVYTDQVVPAYNKFQAELPTKPVAPPAGTTDGSVLAQYQSDLDAYNAVFRSADGQAYYDAINAFDTALNQYKAKLGTNTNSPNYTPMFLGYLANYQDFRSTLFATTKDVTPDSYNLGYLIFDKLVADRTSLLENETQYLAKRTNELAAHQAALAHLREAKNDPTLSPAQSAELDKLIDNITNLADSASAVQQQRSLQVQSENQQLNDLSGMLAAIIKYFGNLMQYILQAR